MENTEKLEIFGIQDEEKLNRPAANYSAVEYNETVLIANNRQRVQ